MMPTALPPMTTLPVSPTSTVMSPPLLEHCLALKELRPVFAFQYGPRTVYMEPVTGSSGIPTAEANTRHIKVPSVERFVTV